MHGYTAEIESRMVAFFNTLGEKDRRRYAGLEGMKLGHGGIAYISQLFGCDPKTITHGKTEIDRLAEFQDVANVGFETQWTLTWQSLMSWPIRVPVGVEILPSRARFRDQ